MLQIVLIIMGIFYFIRRPKIARLTAADLPTIPPETLEQWKQLELKSIDWFLWATWGVSVLGTLFGLLISAALPGSGVAVFIITLTLFLAGLIVSATYGSQASRLKKEMFKQAGLTLP